MTELTDFQREVIELVAGADTMWPLALLFRTPEGPDMRLRTGRTQDPGGAQLEMAATHLRFIASQTDKRLEEVANDVVKRARSLEDADDRFELEPMD